MTVDPDRDWLPWRGAYEDDWVTFRRGRVPYRYLDRIAIMVASGELLEDAQALAATEL